MLKNKYVRRLVYFDKDELINPLFYLFMVSTITWIVALALFPANAAVQSTCLFISLEAISPTARIVWAWVGMAVLTGNFATIFLRKPLLSKIVAFTGFLLWLFAGWSMLLTLNILMLLTVAFPHAFFWVWYYFETLRYERDVYRK